MAGKDYIALGKTHYKVRNGKDWNVFAFCKTRKEAERQVKSLRTKHGGWPHTDLFVEEPERVK